METVEVFLVEDNPADVLLMQVALSQLPITIKLHVAKDGEQALKMLSSPLFHPNLIILDLNMPRVDGQTVLQRYVDKTVPVVIFSSSQNKAEVQKALALGAREYVQKPMGFEPYANAVRGIVMRWIESCSPQPTAEPAVNPA